MTIWTPRHAAATDTGSRTSPIARSMGSPSNPRRSLDWRTSTRTAAPDSTSWRTTLFPTRPVAPVTRYFIDVHLYCPRYAGFVYYEPGQKKSTPVCYILQG